jgi:hypothetical protein
MVLDGKVSNSNAISSVPDAYTVTFEFASLLPNNYNIFLDYLIGGNKIHVGQYVEGKADRVLTSINNRLTPTNQDDANGQDKPGSAPNESK